MNGPEEKPRREHQAPESDVERPIDDAEARQSEEATDANLAMNDEFIDAGNEARLEDDAGVDDRPREAAADYVDAVIARGATGRSSG